VSPLGAALATGITVFVLALFVILLFSRRRAAPAASAQPQQGASYYPPQAFPYADVQVASYPPPPTETFSDDAIRPPDVLVIPPYNVPAFPEPAPANRTQPLPALRLHDSGIQPIAQPMLAAPPVAPPAPAPVRAELPPPPCAVTLPSAKPLPLPLPPPARIPRRASAPSLLSPLASLPTGAMQTYGAHDPDAEATIQTRPSTSAAPVAAPVAPGSDPVELSELDFEDDNPTEFREPIFETQELSPREARHATIPKIRRVVPEAPRAEGPMHRGVDGEPVMPLIRHVPKTTRKVPVAS
jgi:hypothetical protein